MGRRSEARRCSAGAAGGAQQQRRAASRASGVRAAPARPLLLLCAAALLLACHPDAAAGYTVHFVREVPLRGDPLDAMTDAQRAAWAGDLGLSAGATLAALTSPGAAVTVDVKLVGFDGEGNGGVLIPDVELQAHLRSLVGALETVALDPTPQRMLVNPTVEFRVHPTFYKVAPRINAALTAEVAATPPTASFTERPLRLVSPSSVAAILAEDWANTMAGVGSATLYLLNPKVEGGAYAYAYDTEHRACPGGLYLAPEQRFGFFDITATPLFAGPGPSGTGQLLPHSLPSLSHFRPEAARAALAPELAALVWSAAQHLVWPPLAHAGAAWAHSVAVHIVYMHQDLMGAVNHIDRARLESELQGAAGPSQRVVVSEHWVPFGACPHCVAGYTGALRARTSTPREHQRAWAVADTSVFWSPATGRSVSHRWSLGPTPFGPLSTSAALSWPQRDAARRNLVLAALNASAGHAAALIEGVVRVAGPDASVRALLHAEQVSTYNQRMSLLLFKLGAATAALGRMDHASALGYALSTAHDAAALHAMLRRARKGLAVELQCVGARERARWWLVPGGAAAVCFALVAWRAVTGGRGGRGGGGGGLDKRHVY
ncbi:hypothetical protein Rsub_10635 [Raphidocelis subcapitata]|uniref:DUF7906 domain-containing protein n=1 Tax=Raphidocelis subcapitata TaxID=307507 RepID=A0A2V0PG23_9CHLO|nr:hypothetical protein Rsub_10635 [Raphidocelis subcapitata]|eukprot:GBF97962.1 hypothetical protein Rsub_10635 [Raphidocelis subcapitata]